MSLKYYQGPEWSAWILEQAAEDTLSKTRQYNADADVWRMLRPEDLGMATFWGSAAGAPAPKMYYATVTLPPAVATIVCTFRVPAGIGITFMGLWCTGVGNLAMGAVYEIDVNTVKRQQIPLRAQKPANFGFDTSGNFGDWWMRTIVLEQFVFVRQNDLVNLRFYCKHGYTGQLEFFPIAVIAGNRKQLLVAE